jgi:hypothetical protein
MRKSMGRTIANEKASAGVEIGDDAILASHLSSDIVKVGGGIVLEESTQRLEIKVSPTGGIEVNTSGFQISEHAVHPAHMSGNHFKPSGGIFQIPAEGEPGYDSSEVGPTRSFKIRHDGDSLTTSSGGLKLSNKLWGSSDDKFDFRYLSPGQFFYGLHRTASTSTYKLPSDSSTVGGHFYVQGFAASTVKREHISIQGNSSTFTVGNLTSAMTDQERSANWVGNALSFDLDSTTIANGFTHGVGMLDLGKSTLGSSASHHKYVISMARHTDDHLECWINGQYCGTTLSTASPIYKCIVSPSKYMSVEFLHVDLGAARMIRLVFEVKQAW